MQGRGLDEARSMAAVSRRIRIEDEQDRRYDLVWDSGRARTGSITVGDQTYAISKQRLCALDNRHCHSITVKEGGLYCATGARSENVVPTTFRINNERDVENTLGFSRRIFGSINWR